ncbi:Eco57I restriction-modification methylase domain-containing protein, partial [Desulfobacterales bacterium HSG17]|nr:Eco57I restriction-modification methylase domain-containing protein [Desulfobacterales bacterium HSG17]
PLEAETAVSLIGDSKEASLQRFFFWKLYQSDTLLTPGGPGLLEKLIKDQLILEKELEKDFYKEYQAYREKVFQILVKANPDFKGTKGKLVRMTQRFLDRCLFIMFCEDMGAALNFPTNLLRDVLISHSMDDFYDSDDNMAWEKVKKLFTAMRDGTPFLKHKMNRFNGGLFADEPELEQLNIPTNLFCTEHQGTNEETIFSQKLTLLYLSAKYNFGSKGDTQERSIDLYTLGRIFEQSITDLEYMEAKADGRVSITELSKRKRNGVYYTPEWVTHYLVEETVGARLDDIKKELGFDALPPVTDDDIKKYHERLKSKRKKGAPHVNDYLNLIDNYSFALDKIKVVDPSCGSGAFLIQAFEKLFRERQWIAREKERIEKIKSVFDMEQEMKSVLSNNLFGVDINSESVEITRLALWLRTALPNKPLGVLDKNILCGNSLVGSEFYKNKSTKLFSEEDKELVNVFDWEKAFPEIFKNGGFDCVIGNPPYIKLQHFRKAQPEITEYLLTAKKEDGTLKYESAQTGNFDMYLPFIEMGIELLNEKGRMGYIAPNVWMMNEYGKGLRNKLKKTKRLDRWIDFKSFQVFDEAITYTALQFFKGDSCNSVKCYFGPDGDISNLDWRNENIDSVEFDELPENKSWNLLPDSERILIERLNNEFKRLDDCCKGIVVGIQTSADYIYHLNKIASGKFQHKQKNKKIIEVEIEDELMKPLVSGPEAKRYNVPNTNTYLLFPYDLSGKKPRLWTEKEMEEKFPKGWAYLKSYEKDLRSRERGKMN